MRLSSLRRQRGITLLESLAALVVLALAMLGMVGAQLRTLAETQTGVRRAQAVRLVEDLAERIKANPAGFRQLPNYVTQWDAAPQAPDCRATPCDAASLAAFDIATWKQSVADILPLGKSKVFEITGGAAAGAARQLGVMVGWRANERASDDASYGKPFAVDAGDTPVECPAGLICHLVYVQP
jgi:type IV pilus assembly protein PilV